MTKNRHGCDSRQVCFQTEEYHIYSFIRSLLCLYSGGGVGGGALDKGGMLDVFFAELLEFDKCTMKNRSLASIKNAALTCLF